MSIKVKTLCCPECGSDNIVWQSWTDEHDNYVSGGREYTDENAVCCNDNCEYINEDINPILKSEYKKEV